MGDSTVTPQIAMIGLHRDSMILRHSHGGADEASRDSHAHDVSGLGRTFCSRPPDYGTKLRTHTRQLDDTSIHVTCIPCHLSHTAGHAGGETLGRVAARATS
jgi:hypothetical protein